MQSSREREAVRIWMENGTAGERWVYVETRHSRKILALEEFIARVREKLSPKKKCLGCGETDKTDSREQMVRILRVGFGPEGIN